MTSTKVHNENIWKENMVVFFENVKSAIFKYLMHGRVIQNIINLGNKPLLFLHMWILSSYARNIVIKGLANSKVRYQYFNFNFTVNILPFNYYHLHPTL